MLVNGAVAFDNIPRPPGTPFPMDGICSARCAVLQGAWSITVTITRLPKKSIDERISSSVSLASQLAERYMHTKLEVSEFVDISSGAVVSNYSFRVPGSAQSLVGVDAHSALLTADQSWLVIDCHASARDLRDYQQFLLSLRSLGIPHESLRGFEELVGWKKQHSVVVISETTLSVKQLDVLLDVQRVTAGSLVVISSANQPAHFRDAYGLEVAACMGTSVRSIYDKPS